MCFSGKLFNFLYDIETEQICRGLLQMSYEIFSVAQFLVVDIYDGIAESDWPSPYCGQILVLIHLLLRFFV